MYVHMYCRLYKCFGTKNKEKDLHTQVKKKEKTPLSVV